MQRKREIERMVAATVMMTSLVFKVPAHSSLTTLVSGTVEELLVQSSPVGVEQLAAQSEQEQGKESKDPTGEDSHGNVCSFIAVEDVSKSKSTRKGDLSLDPSD